MGHNENENIYIKKYEFYIISSVVILLMIFIGIISIVNKKTTIISQESTISSKNSTNVEDVFKDDNNKESETYIRYEVKEYNGKIGIYKNNSLIYTMDIYTFTLPEYDRNLLACGIKTSSVDELYNIIAEYYK